MKKNFISGLVTGIGGALLVFLIVFTVYTQVNGGVNEDNKGTQVEKQVEKQVPEVVEDPYEKIVHKLSLLEKIIDSSYLEEIDKEAYADGIYKGFINSLGDPYSTYYTKAEYTQLVESSSGIYCGIGAVVTQDVKTGIITIVKPYESGPAYKAGLLPGDIIYKVEGEEVTGDDLSEVVGNMKGIEGTKVNITIVRSGENDPIDFTIKRQEIEIPTIEYKMLEDKIGYIIISAFDEVTIKQFKKAVDELEKSGMKGLVIDLRNNGGGLLESVVRMLDRLLPKGLIVYTEDKYGKRIEENAVDKEELKLPMAVLINGYSASASEIFAGAIQDYETGTIVGTTSFGKGIVQKVIPLTDGTAMKLTISKYYTPKGRNIHGTGIEPDIAVELKDELKQKLIITIEEDNQLQEAIKVVEEKIK